MYERTYHKEVLKEATKKAPIDKKKKRKFSFKKFLFIVLLIGLLTSVFFLLRSPHFQIKSVMVSGTSVIDNQDIQDDVFKMLEGNKLWFFPRVSTFLINKDSIEQNLKKDFSRIETIGVKQSDFTTLSVNIKEYDALYLWCTSLESEDCYFMDKNGVVYNSAPVFSGAAYPKVITDGKIETLPFSALSPENAKLIFDFEKKLSGIGIAPVAFQTISPKYLKINFVHNKTSSELRVDPSIPADTSLEYLFSALRSQPFSDLFANTQKKLLYIDVRFSNKVVYKFDEE